jgi:hypothetical protein
MDYETFDNDSGDASDADYTAFVEWLSEHAATELREAKGNPQQQKQALCRYYRRGLRASLTAGELVDLLGVSSPSILDRAGYNEEEGAVVMAISDSLSDEDVDSSLL